MTCECGCGTEIPGRDNRGRSRRFVRGHNATRGARGGGWTLSAEARANISAGLRGRVISPETRAKIAATKRGSLNAAWKGDAAKYAAIHMWLHRNVQKVGACADCGAEGRTEWANISGEYRRGADDYRELCATCHRRFDRERRITLNLGKAA